MTLRWVGESGGPWMIEGVFVARVFLFRSMVLALQSKKNRAS